MQFKPISPELAFYETPDKEVILNPYIFTSVAPFNPADYGTVKLDLDASKLTGLSNNDPVATWTDQSGLSNNATQSTSGNRPLYKTNRINGQPTVYFDGSDDFMNGASALPTGGRTIYIVGKSANSTGGSLLVFGAQSSAGNAYLLRLLYAGIQYIGGDVQTTNQTIATNLSTVYQSPFIGTWSKPTSNGNTSFWFNGTNYTVSGNPPSADQSPTGYTIGKLISANIQYWTGDVARILVYDGEHDSTARAGVWTGLNSIYGT